MANLPESAAWEDGIFQWELTTPATGGAAGVATLPLRQLANRTAYLKAQVETRAPLDGAALTGSPSAPTPPDGDATGRLATTAFVDKFLRRSGGTMTGDVVFRIPDADFGTRRIDFRDTAEDTIGSLFFQRNNTGPAARAGVELRGTGGLPVPVLFIQHDAVLPLVPLVLPAPASDPEAARRRDLGSQWLATVAPTGTPTWVELALPADFDAFDLTVAGCAPVASAPLIAQVSTTGGMSWLTTGGDYAVGSVGTTGSFASASASVALLSFGTVLAGAMAGGGFSARIVRPAGGGNTHLFCQSSHIAPGNTWIGGMTFSSTGAAANRLRLGWSGSAWANQGRLILRGVRP